MVMSLRFYFTHVYNIYLPILIFSASNRCLDGTHNCHQNAWCLYTSLNTTRCTCKTGYEGDGILSCNSKT